MFEEIKPLFANIGFGVCAKKVMAANFCMNMICQKCPNVTFTLDSVSTFVNIRYWVDVSYYINFQMPATTKNVPFYISIQKAKFGIVLGTIEDFVDMDLCVVIGMFEEFYV